jgi:hypothetical protein
MDVVALVSVTTSGLVGITVAGASLLNSAAQRRHERETAHRGRVFERQAQTYVELLTQLSRISERVEQTHPMISFGPPPGSSEAEEAEEKTAPSKEEQERGSETLRDLEARLAAYGSTTLVAKVEAFGQQVRNFYLDVGTYDRIERRTVGDGWLEARKAMDAGRQGVRDLHAEIRELVRGELASP